MKKEEKDYLKAIHKSEGYSSSKIHKSIKNLENSQVKFKVLNKELKKKDTVIRNLESKIEKLKARLDKANNPVINIKKEKKNLGRNIFMDDVNREEYEKNRVLINRIDRNMETGKLYTKTDIKRDFLVYYKKLDFCINYLLRKGIIESSIINGFANYKKVE